MCQDLRFQAGIRKGKVMEDIQIRGLFDEPEKYDGKEIRVRGWIRTNRGSNKFGFIELNDGSNFTSLQIVYEAEKISDFDEISKAPISAALDVTGMFILTPDAKQPFEMHDIRVHLTHSYCYGFISG